MTSPRRTFLRSLSALSLVALASSGLAGCASANPNYYRIVMTPGAAMAGAPGVIEVRSISIPGYLDRDGIIKSAAETKLDIHSNELWAEPLADMLQATMVQDLAQRLTGSTVIGSGGAIGANPAILVEINVLGFDPDASGTMVLSAQVAIREGASLKTLMTQSIRRTGPSGGPTVTGIANGMSVLWGQAADDIAALVVQNWRAGASSPPGG
jgi:uncharacterized lipoprotein YmbA